VYNRPAPLSLLPIKWQVYSDKNLKKLLQAIADMAYVCLTVKGYENLAKNMAELERYMSELRTLVEVYEDERSSDTDPDSD